MYICFSRKSCNCQRNFEVDGHTYVVIKFPTQVYREITVVKLANVLTLCVSKASEPFSQAMCVILCVRHIYTVYWAHH